MWIFWWIEINILLKALHDMELCGSSLRQIISIYLFKINDLCHSRAHETNPVPALVPTIYLFSTLDS